MLDWEDMRCFLAIARAGSLSAAARALKSSQPTMGRRLDALEARAGVKLLLRTAQGYVPTEAGAAILDNVQRMEAEALSAERRVMGHEAGLDGLVRVTSSDWFGFRVLAPIFARFGQAHPSVTIELLTDPRAYSLVRREADLAFRFMRFAHNELVQRKVADIAFGLYAAASYLDRVGPPDFAAGCPGHALVTMNEDLGHLADVPWLSQLASSARVTCRSNSRDVQAAACAEGAGLAVLPCCIGESTGLVRLEAPSPVPSREIWLGLHQDLRAMPRIRALVDFTAAALTERYRRDPGL